MTEFLINVSEVEDLQTIANIIELEQIFARAKSTVNQGGTVVLCRKFADGQLEKFDELSTEPDLEEYRQTVFKYL